MRIPDIPYTVDELEAKINGYFTENSDKRWGLYALAEYLGVDGEVLKKYFLDSCQTSKDNSVEENGRIRLLKKARTRIIAQLETSNLWSGNNSTDKIFNKKQPWYGGFSDTKTTDVNLSEIKISFGKLGDKGFD